MNRVPQQGHDLVIFEGKELDQATHRAVAESELAQGNTVSAYGISLHAEEGKTVLVVEGKDYRSSKSAKDVLGIVAKYRNAKSVLAALALTVNAAAQQPAQAAPEDTSEDTQSPEAPAAE